MLDTSEAKKGTRMAAVPMRNEVSVVGLFYQEDSGRVVNYKQNKNESSEVWANSSSPEFPPLLSRMLMHCRILF